MPPGDAETWSSYMQNALCACHARLDIAYLGMDDSPLSASSKAALDPEALPLSTPPQAGNDRQPGQQGRLIGQSVHSVGAVQAALDQLAGFLDILERMLTLPFPVAAPIPAHGILMLLTRILSTDDSARQAGILNTPTALWKDPSWHVAVGCKQGVTCDLTPPAQSGTRQTLATVPALGVISAAVISVCCNMACCIIRVVYNRFAFRQSPCDIYFARHSATSEFHHTLLALVQGKCRLQRLPIWCCWLPFLPFTPVPFSLCRPFSRPAKVPCCCITPPWRSCSAVCCIRWPPLRLWTLLLQHCS